MPKAQSKRKINMKQESKKGDQHQNLPNWNSIYTSEKRTKQKIKLFLTSYCSHLDGLDSKMYTQKATEKCFRLYKQQRFYRYYGRNAVSSSL